MSSYQLKSNLKLRAQNGLPNLPFVAIQLYWQETKMVSSITCLSFYHVSIILMKNFILVLEKSTEMVSTVIRKTGKTQVKRKFPPASNATVIDWSFDAADNYCQNGQEISRHRRATSFTRANERGHT